MIRIGTVRISVGWSQEAWRRDEVGVGGVAKSEDVGPELGPGMIKSTGFPDLVRVEGSALPP